MTLDAGRGTEYQTRSGVVRVATDGHDAGPETLVLEVLGRRAGMPGAGEPSSGYLVHVGAATLLFDCGPGTAGALRGALGGRAPDAVFVTHLHMDHCYDLVPIAKSLLAPLVTYPRNGQAGGLTRPVRATPCYLPPGAPEVFRTLQSLFPVHTSPPLDRAFDLVFDAVEVEPGTRYQVAGCEVTAVAMRHAVPACGFRLTSGAGSFAYTGDTGWTDALLDLAAGVDVLLCEATLREPDTGPHGHLSATEAGRLAALAGVGVLVLTHVQDTDDAATAQLRSDASSCFDGPIALAEPRTTFTFYGTDRTAQP
ncbi:MBL fold metallo-hydrolase [Cryptosporangium aurantiacum]|uniref:Ribonuclease BN, tRNA processing enzyme n=1 Tax=Cryptosporangium aurantiacum TaxID=134849 RepID=A0A1M7RLU2_9ACTN|nr:MBL fold metallo-hydrolase [Cryptosporangium aurantiacum]SHN47295.1 Ribonuclease BN, tRNA processing enzyme [Cryptosporangium aurantiacum]